MRLSLFAQAQFLNPRCAFCAELFTFNAADGPQSLIVVPEATGNVPHKKAEIEFFASKCVANCALPADNANTSAERVTP